MKVPIETDDELRNEPQRGEQASGSEMSADASAQTEEKETGSSAEQAADAVEELDEEAMVADGNSPWRSGG